MIEVDTIQYLPLHIAEIEEFEKIAKIYDKYLRLVWQSLKREELNRVLATMDESECSYWEELLHIVVNPADTLVQYLFNSSTIFKICATMSL